MEQKGEASAIRTPLDAIDGTDERRLPPIVGAQEDATLVLREDRGRSCIELLVQRHEGERFFIAQRMDRIGGREDVVQQSFRKRSFI